ncbi:MAG: hypothetical protein M1834_008390 [Cirrosporium novae-zelandiae]|nr:MAG: hypothetical protein M1834_008390 [Cirrosporium novae-zelandiae]
MKTSFASSILPLALSLFSSTSTATPISSRQTGQFNIQLYTPTYFGHSTSPYQNQYLFISGNELVSKVSSDGAAVAFFDGDELKFDTEDGVWALQIPSSTGPVTVSDAEGTGDVVYDYTSGQPGIWSSDSNFGAWYMCPGLGDDDLPRLFVIMGDDGYSDLPDVGCGAVRLEKKSLT